VSKSSRIATSLVQRLHARSCRRAFAELQRAARDPEPYLRDRLFALLRENAGSAYGSMYRFSHIDSLRAWQEQVPIVDYDVLAPWIDRISAGEPRVLTEEPVLVFERSSGSTAANKLIPYTRGLLREFSAATAPWFSELYTVYPRLIGTQSYWSVSQAQKKDERTASGIRIGFSDDTEYFAWSERVALRFLMAVPNTVSRAETIEAWRDETLVHLLEARTLGMISVWSPTFLAALMRWLETHFDRLLARVSGRRRKEIAGVSEAIWPKLALISCWADGASEPYVQALRKWFPTTPIQPKGLLATEGVVSFPTRRGNVAALTSHVLEFLPEDGGPARWPWELELGRRYSPLLSTRGGFYRYHLKDVVEHTGWYEKLPLLRFVAKLDRVSDLCGEKLNAGFVERCLAPLRPSFGFALIAPSTQSDPPHYQLFVEGAGDPDALAATVDARLQESHHYRYARELGQLGPLVAVAVERGSDRYEAALRARGMKAGDIKPTVLDARTDWAEWMKP
jgi:hypothetical protein